FNPPAVIHANPPPVSAPPQAPPAPKPPIAAPSGPPMARPVLPPKPKRPWAIPPWKTLALWGGGVVLVLFAGYYIYSHIWSRSPFGATPGTPSEVNEPAQAAASASAEPSEGEIISKVSNLMLLPEETPVIAKVSDLSALSGQAFFAHAKVGDIVL